MKKLVMAAAVLVGLLTACKDEEVFYDPIAAGESYYPLQVGSYWIYNVTDITYLNNVGDTTEFEQREQINGIITDQTGKSWYRVQVSKRSAGETAWTNTGIKLLARTDTDLQVNENNVTKVHMIFPVKNQRTWNPNAFNGAGTSEYYYDQVGTPATVNGTAYANTATIVKAASLDSLISNNKQREVVAEGVGPVYRYYNVVNYCAGGSGSNCNVGENYITSGRKRVDLLTDHGLSETQ